MKHCCHLRNWSWHAAADVVGNGLSTWCLPCCAYQRGWGVSLSICSFHVTILTNIQMYHLYEICQGIMNNPVYPNFIHSCLYLTYCIQIVGSTLLNVYIVWLVQHISFIAIQTTDKTSSKSLLCPSPQRSGISSISWLWVLSDIHNSVTISSWDSDASSVPTQHTSHNQAMSNFNIFHTQKNKNT